MNKKCNCKKQKCDCSDNDFIKQFDDVFLNADKKLNKWEREGKI